MKRVESVLHHKRIFFLFSIWMVFCLLLAACGGQNPEKSGEQQQKQDNKKAIKALDDLSQQNEKIMKLLKGPSGSDEEQAKGQEKDSQEQGGGEKQEGGQEQGGEKQEGGQEQGGEKKEDGQEQGGEKKDGGQEQGSGQEQGGQGQQDEKAQKGQELLEQGSKLKENDWKQLSTTIIELHTMFNEYMPMAMQQGASQELNTKATDTLNELTVQIKDRDQTKALQLSNNLSGYISELYALHQDKRAPIKRIQYYARSIILAALVEDWQTSDAAIKELRTVWDMQKAAVAEKEKDTAAQVDLAIANLQEVIGEKNPELVKIKGNILMDNLAELEKGMKPE